MLILRKAQIEQSVQAEMERLRVVEARLQQIDTHGQMQELDVVLKSVPTQHFLALHEVLPDVAAVRQLVEHMAHFVPAMVGQHNLGHIAIVIHSPMYDPEAFDFEIGYLLTGKVPRAVRLAEERVLTVRELSAIEIVATLVHVGRVRDIHQSYGALGQWVEQHGWQVTGTGRQILMQLPLHGNADDAVVELQLPVSKIDRKVGLDFDVTSKPTL
jgi:effector-binding domain-containing protein